MSTTTRTHPVPHPRTPIDPVTVPEPFLELPEGHRWYDADLDTLTGCPIGAELAAELSELAALAVTK